jgi:Trk K+ transport system NAD-binding subunit
VLAGACNGVTTGGATVLADCQDPRRPGFVIPYGLAYDPGEDHHADAEQMPDEVARSTVVAGRRKTPSVRPAPRRRTLGTRARLLGLAGLVVLVVLVSTGLYMAGMRYLEHEPRDFWRSFQWASETLTTTGYGADSRWHHPLMVLLVVVVQFLGVFLVFLVFPIYLIPFLEERFEARLPESLPALSGHVVIFHSGPAVTSLLAQLDAAGVASVVIEPDKEEARRLVEHDRQVLVRRLEDDALAAASLPVARALIANGTDAENANVTLAARQLGFTGEVVCLVEEPFHRRPMTLAGATAVFTPRHMLGAALAARASRRISPRISGVRQLGKKLEVGEVKILPGSNAIGRTLAGLDVGARTGATVVGQWVGGDLHEAADSSMRLEANGVLVAVGSEESLSRLEHLVERGVPRKRGGHFVVGGFGEVGRKVVELLTDVGEEARVIDRTAGEGVDLVGDFLDVRLLEAAQVAEAQAVILALDSDNTTLFATVIIKDLAPETAVIARVNQAENVERIYRAGADFALSISEVSGEVLARRLLGRETVDVDPALKVVKVSAAPLVGERPETLGIRRRTGCSVVAVERGDDVLVELGPDFAFEAGDAVYISGSRDAVERFQQEFGV